jgi:hypothetical protein
MDTCPGCGMERDAWRGSDYQGVEKGGQTFCCQGCADNGSEGCICGS